LRGWVRASGDGRAATGFFVETGGLDATALT